MGDGARIGVISSLEPGGYARIYYPDRDETTAPLHLFAGHGEYSPPEVGTQVIVLHLSNDSSTAVVMGEFWGAADPPPQEMDYQKQITRDIYITARAGTYTIRAADIQFQGSTGSIMLSEIIDLKERVRKLEEAGGS